MASIYTTQLGNGVVTGAGGTTLYTVPAAKRVILTDLVIVSLPAAAAERFYMTIGSGVACFYESTGTAVHEEHWSGKQVLNAGQVLGIVYGGGTTFYAATGYVLDI